MRWPARRRAAELAAELLAGRCRKSMELGSLTLDVGHRGRASPDTRILVPETRPLLQTGRVATSRQARTRRCKRRSTSAGSRGRPPAQAGGDLAGLPGRKTECGRGLRKKVHDEHPPAGRWSDWPLGAPEHTELASRPGFLAVAGHRALRRDRDRAEGGGLRARRQCRCDRPLNRRGQLSTRTLVDPDLHRAGVAI